MGYTFVLDGEQYQKCRYMAFQPALSEKNNPYIKQFLERIAGRCSVIKLSLRARGSDGDDCGQNHISGWFSRG